MFYCVISIILTPVTYPLPSLSKQLLSAAGLGGHQLWSVFWRVWWERMETQQGISRCPLWYNKTDLLLKQR